MNRIKELRQAGAKTLGKSLTQQEASELINASSRSWYTWEAGTREMSSTAVELFCLKTGLEYTPDLLRSKDPIVKSRPKANRSIVSDELPKFITLTNSYDHLTITINSSLIKMYRLNRKTKGTSIELVTGETLEVEQKINILDDTLNSKMLADEMFS